ncbi:hypothetical protein HNP89_000075 [Methanococcus maripaludis]|uniref:Uncharacterized protein n=1 Tax=Methanococcus maripaludis TaxID=39152 RepID=A0A7J9NWQ3_METMI|nr:hypothetical protein [Methanococcus maripaludis]MBA2852138.1 hypothetical protein [Methanococcus maripaludis]
MYQNTDKNDLAALFDKYIESENYKDKTEAAKILGLLDEQALDERMQKIAILNSDPNIAVLLNLLSSIKVILLKYPKKAEKLLIHVYINTEFSNHLVKEFSRQIIDSINPKVIDNLVVHHNSKLYSKNNFEVAQALLVLGFVSMHSPRYLKNSLPELSMISLYSRSELLRILSQAILDEFENIPKSIIKDLKFLIESPDINENSINAENDLLKKLVILNLKNEINNDELSFILKYVDDEDYKIALLSAITIKKHQKLLKTLIHSKNELDVHSLISGKLYDSDEITAINAMLAFSYLTIGMNLEMDTKKCLKLIENPVKEYLTHENYLICFYGFEMMNSFVLLNNNELNLSIEKILENKDLGKLFGKNNLNYYSGTRLLVNLGRYDLLSPEKNMYFDEDLMIEYGELPKNRAIEQFKNLEKEFKNEDWLYRFEIGKKIGNLLYAFPSEINYKQELIQAILTDRVYLVRSIGAWILQIILERGFKIPEKLIIESIACLDDPNMEIRQDCAIFYNKLIKKYPEILKNSEISSKLQGALATKYFTDHFTVIRTICEDTLKMIPESKELIGYESKNLEEKFKTLEKALDHPELNKSVVIRLKVKLKSYIRSNDSENIIKILEFIEKQDLTEEYFDVFHELFKLKKDFEIANELLKRLKNKFSKVPKSREAIIYGNLNEMIISRRITAVNEIFEYILEDYVISERITRKIKEFVIYPQANPKITELSLKILEKINTEESKKIFKEKQELENYILENNFESEVVDVKNQTWQEIYFSLKYLLTQDYKTLNYVDLEFSDFMKFSILNSEKNSLIITIILMDIVMANLKSGNNTLMYELGKYKKSVLDNIFKIIFNEKYPLLAYKGIECLKVIITKKTSWFEESVLNAENFEEYLPLISKLLDENEPQIQVEALETLAGMVKLNVKCTEHPEISKKVLGLINDDKKWIIFKKALEVIYSCNFEDNTEMLEKVSKQIIEYLKTSNDDSKLFLIKFFKIKGIDKIPDYLFDELKTFEKSSNPYVSSEIAELTQKRKMNMNY